MCSKAKNNFVLTDLPTDKLKEGALAAELRSMIGNSCCCPTKKEKEPGVEATGVGGYDLATAIGGGADMSDGYADSLTPPFDYIISYHYLRVVSDTSDLKNKSM